MSADSTFLQIETAAHGGAFGDNPIPAPTEAQCLSGNYKVGRASIYGLAIAIEQPRGSYRTGIDSKTGKRWASRMAAHYGYINGTKGNDGDCVDCFIGFYPQSQAAFVINQNVGGKFDEHKVMLAYPDEESARRAYLDSYERGWNGLASVVSLSVSQLKWWLKNGDMRRPLRAENLPHEGLETMTRKVQWNSEALPYDQTLDQVLYEIRRSDAGESLLLDAVSAKDIIEDADGALAFDALVTPYAKLERKMEVLQGVMVRSGESVKPVAMQVTEPFKQRGVANVAAIFELSDGQTVSIFFHNPDVTPNKMAASDEVISWKWLLNKKDITIVVAPERGEDLNVREVARRIIRLAEKNSPAFQRANTKRAERMQGIQALKDEITTLETELATAQHELEVAKVSAEDRAARSGAMIAWKTPLAELGGAEVTAPKYKEGDAVSFNLEPLGSPFFKPEKTTSGTIAKIRTYETESKGAMGGEFKKISYAYDILKTDGKTQDAVEEDYILGSTEVAKVDITYRNSADGLFTSFFPDTPEGEKAWNIINATPGAEGGKVLAAHAEPTIEQLRKAGYTVEEDTSAPSAVDDDALLAELAASDAGAAKATKEDADKALAVLRPFMSASQIGAVKDGMRGEEAQFFFDKAVELAGIVSTMPKTYDQDGKGDDAVAYLHYFRGAGDWYITEKDMGGTGTEQAFGLADLGSGGELGYISIAELVGAGVELDFHFEPKTIGKIKGVPDSAGEETQHEQVARSGTAEEQAAADAALVMASDVVVKLGGTFTADGYSGKGTIGAWSYGNAVVNGETIRLAASGGGVVQVNGKPHGPDGELNLSANQVSAAILAVAPAKAGNAESGEKVDYTKMFDPAVIKEMNVIKHLRDSVLAAQHEGNSETVIESDRILSLFVDTLAPQQFKNYDHSKAEEVLFGRLHEIELEIGLGVQPNPQKEADRALFQSVIDGSIPDILAPELADSLEAAYYRQQTDPALVSLFEQAVGAYQNAMMSATAELA